MKWKRERSRRGLGRKCTARVTASSTLLQYLPLPRLLVWACPPPSSQPNTQEHTSEISQGRKRFPLFPSRFLASLKVTFTWGRLTGEKQIFYIWELMEIWDSNKWQSRQPVYLLDKETEIRRNGKTEGSGFALCLGEAATRFVYTDFLAPCSPSLVTRMPSTLLVCDGVSLSCGWFISCFRVSKEVRVSFLDWLFLK